MKMTLEEKEANWHLRCELSNRVSVLRRDSADDLSPRATLALASLVGEARDETSVFSLEDRGLAEGVKEELEASGFIWMITGETDWRVSEDGFYAMRYLGAKR